MATDTRNLRSLPETRIAQLLLRTEDRSPDPVMVGGLEIWTARLAEPGRRKRDRMWVAALKYSDMLAGRCGIGQTDRAAIEDLLRYLRDRYLPAPLG